MLTPQDRTAPPPSTPSPKLLTVTLEFKYCPSTSDPAGWNEEIKQVMRDVYNGILRSPDGLRYADGTLCSWAQRLRVTDHWGDCAALIAGDEREVEAPEIEPTGECEDCGSPVYEDRGLATSAGGWPKMLTSRASRREQQVKHRRPTRYDLFMHRAESGFRRMAAKTRDLLCGEDAYTVEDVDRKTDYLVGEFTPGTREWHLRLAGIGEYERAGYGR